MKFRDFCTGTGTRNYQEEILQELQRLRRDISDIRHILFHSNKEKSALFYSNKEEEERTKKAMRRLRNEAEAADVYIDLRGQDRRAKITE